MRLTKLPLAALALFLMAAPQAAHAQIVFPQQDDSVTLTLTAENWVTTKSARILVGIEAAVTSSTSGSTRTAMAKAVNDAIKADWRLVSFNRNQDSTGMERWSAEYEARVPESDLANVHESLKKLSKAGMQLAVRDIQFTPTLDETQAAESQLRTQIYKKANEELASLNAAIPGRTYRIADINFTRNGTGGGRPPMLAKAMRSMPMAAEMADTAPEPMERAQKLTLTAQLTLSATPPSTEKK